MGASKLSSLWISCYSEYAGIEFVVGQKKFNQSILKDENSIS
jgi:hypothetical protein